MLFNVLASFIFACAAVVAAGIVGLLGATVIASMMGAGVLTSSVLAGLLARRWSLGLWFLALQFGVLAGAITGAAGLLFIQAVWEPFTPSEVPWAASTLSGAGGGALLALTLGAMCRTVAQLLYRRYGTYLEPVAPI